MKKFILICFICSTAYAKQAGWGVRIEAPSSKNIKIGGRLQAIVLNDSETESQDFYLRRVRLNLEYYPMKNHKIVYDIRNDKANYQDKGEGEFSIGDAYWQINFNKYSINNIKIFRAKVDVSYSQTSSSKNLFNPNRATISELASDFVVHNRRAANAQINGRIQNITYQVAVSDGVNSEDLDDINGNSVSEVNFQKFTYGAKVRYYLLGDASKSSIQDTFYSEYSVLSLGTGYFNNDKINYSYNNSDFSVARSLTNFEISFAYAGFRILAESFILKNSLLDLDATEDENRYTNTTGHYVQVEYLFTEKLAPYIILEDLNYADTKNFNSKENSTTIGLNYYENLEAFRFGIAFKKTKKAQILGEDSDKIYAYTMMNF